MKNPVRKVFAFLGMLAVLAAFVAAMLFGAYYMIPAGHAKPHVTMEPGDQKRNMGMYADAYGPPFAQVEYNGAIRMPWGVCMKPAIVVGVKDRNGYVVNIYAEDTDDIWRCLQAHPTGEPIPLDEAPIVYCLFQDKPRQSDGGNPMKCYHDYRVIFNTYENEWGKAPIIARDEVEFVPQ